MQDDKGNVTLRFTKREGSSSRISTKEVELPLPPRPSFENNSRRSSVKLDNVDFTPNIPQPSEQNFIIELVDKIPDPNLQKEYFKKYLEIQNKIVKNN